MKKEAKTSPAKVESAGPLSVESLASEVQVKQEVPSSEDEGLAQEAVIQRKKRRRQEDTKAEVNRGGKGSIVVKSEVE